VHLRLAREFLDDLEGLEETIRQIVEAWKRRPASR